jgi:hypothetical protein
MQPRLRLLFVIIALNSVLALAAQDAPLITGGLGWITTVADGNTSAQPVIAPVAVVPLGGRFVVESRADIRGFLFWPKQGDFSSSKFTTLEYLQLDFIANKRLTITAGKFLTPFGTYNERLSAIWIHNFEDAPIIYPIGTRSTGYSTGGMIRGALFSNPKVEFNYIAYVAASSSVEQFQSARTAGFRGSFFFPGQRLEIGTSYQRFLQDTLNGRTTGVPIAQQDANNTNNVGVHLWWQPRSVALHIKSEFAHSQSGYGYWIEGAYRVGHQSGSTNWVNGLEPLIRYQQFFRTSFHRGDLLPATNEQQADFGLNYYLPRAVRLTANYSRQFAPAGDRNIWNFGITYRFMLPLAKGGI